MRILSNLSLQGYLQKVNSIMKWSDELDEMIRPFSASRSIEWEHSNWLARDVSVKARAKKSTDYADVTDCFS